MPASPVDEIAVSRSGVNGKITVGEIINITNPYDPSQTTITSDGTYRYFAYVLRSGLGFEASRRNLKTGLKEGVASGTLPLPEDLSTLTYI